MTSFPLISAFWRLYSVLFCNKAYSTGWMLMEKLKKRNFFPQSLHFSIIPNFRLVNLLWQLRIFTRSILVFSRKMRGKEKRLLNIDNWRLKNDPRLKTLDLFLTSVLWRLKSVGLWNWLFTIEYWLFLSPHGQQSCAILQKGNQVIRRSRHGNQESFFLYYWWGARRVEGRAVAGSRHPTNRNPRLFLTG